MTTQMDNELPIPLPLTSPLPLLDRRNAREAAFPIVYPDLHGFYQRHVACFWTPEEVDLTGDRAHWESLGDDERYFVTRVLAFFATSDFIVNENLAQSFAAQVTVPEVRMFYHFQAAMEDIHSLMYAKLLEAFTSGQEELDALLNGVKTVPSIGAKAAWARKWIRDGSFVQRLVAFAVVEGVFFSSSFCSIFWLKSRGLMPGLAASNELIARDESLHRDFACTLYTRHTPDSHRLPRDELYRVVEEAVALECAFVQESLPVGLIGMNADTMCRYVHVVANHLIASLGEPVPGEPVENPFPFMDTICLDTKTNFFEGRVTAYRRAVAPDQDSQAAAPGQFGDDF
jgi:ribonucleoside-diphosphate reductase beta chain